MRLVIALAATLLSFEPALAEEPPQTIEEALDASVDASFIEDNCPKYQVDHDRLRALWNERGIKPSDFNRYAEHIVTRKSSNAAHLNADREQFCDALAALYGQNGPSRGLIVKR